MFRWHSSLIILRRHLHSTISDANSSKLQSSCFKSHLSIDKIYPNSNPDYLRKTDQGQSFNQPRVSDSKNQEQFTGCIPVEQVQISISRSGGPGGQNVNKVNSKVEVRFHLETASWIPDWIKVRLAEQAEGKITKDGYLVVRSDMTRKQLLNQADCMNKLRNLIFAASMLPRQPTKEEIKIKEERIAKAKAGILREKKHRSLQRQQKSALESF